MCMTGKIIDLTLSVEHGSKVYEANPTCFFNSYQNIRSDGYNLTQVILNSHAGTHIDAPYHFVENGLRLDEIPVERLMGDAIVIDCTHRAAKEMIILDDISKYHSRIRENGNIIIRTDWDKIYPSSRFAYDMPNLSLECIEYFVDRKINLLGLQTPSLNLEDNVKAHCLLLGAGILLVEGLANLDQLKGDEFFFICLPPKLKGIDGFLVRAIGVEGD